MTDALRALPELDRERGLFAVTDDGQDHGLSHSGPLQVRDDVVHTVYGSFIDGDDDISSSRNGLRVSGHFYLLSAAS